MNHFDLMMDGVRTRAFTLFSAITSVAAALYHWAPDTLIKCFGYNLRISALVELSIFLVLIPLYIQNRLYHYWLYRTRQTLNYLEEKIYSKIQEDIESKDVMLTYSLTKESGKIRGYWQTMLRSKLFLIDLFIFLFITMAGYVLFICFSTSMIEIK